VNSGVVLGIGGEKWGIIRRRKLADFMVNFNILWIIKAGSLFPLN